MRSLCAIAVYRLRFRPRSGTAAVEFGLLAPVMATTVILMLDFGRAFYMKLEVVKALNAAAYYAFLNAQLVTATTVTTYLANVQTVAQSTTSLSSTPAATVLFNNASDSSSSANFYCLTGYAPVIWTSTGTASASCGDGNMSGKFVTITLTTTANSFFSADPVFGSSITMADTAMIRFQ